MSERTFPAWAALRATDTLHMSVERSMFFALHLAQVADDYLGSRPSSDLSSDWAHSLQGFLGISSLFHMNGRNLFPMFPELFPIFNLSIFFLISCASDR